MQTSSVGCGVSADTDTMAETVTPCRPATPSVVTTLTVQAAWLIPTRNCWRSARSGPLTGASRRRARGTRGLGVRIFVIHDSRGQIGGLADELQRPIPVEVPINGGEMRKGRRLGKQLEGQAMTRVVR